MENMEGSEGTPTKISDSGYSNSCGNSQSQRSGSTKSRHSGSNSSGSSGYGGKGSSSNPNSNEAIPQPLSKHKELKKKKSKNTVLPTPTITPESSTERSAAGGSSTSQECVTSEEDNKNSLLTSTLPIPSQQHTEDTDKNCLTPASIHSTQETNNNTNREEDVNKIQTPISPLKAGSLVPLAGETTSVSESLGGKQSENENGCLSPSKFTNDSYYICRQSSNASKNYQLKTSNGGFSCVVSMRDGVVLYTNSSINTALGYPKDMWLGRSFIDFVHPKDRNTFASHITSGVVWPFTQSTINDKNKHGDTSKKLKTETESRNPLFCRVRKYRGLRGSPGNTGYGVREREIFYAPFRLDFSFKDINNIENSGMYLVITATPVMSAYTDSKNTSPRFAMRHTSSGIISHANPETVECLGYLPQDIIGRCIFDFYHPEDVQYLKEVYETITKKESIFRSKPYRLSAQNGDYLTVETDWSAFINPWSRKLEFVVGYHYVIQGPANSDIFQSTKTDANKGVSEDVIKQNRMIQDEILKILNEQLIKPFETEKQLVSKRCKELATFMEGLTEAVTRSDDELRIEIPKEKSLSERDSVMLGEISPHHDYDSKSSTETPPSYNQLNYSENLQRFFESHPWTSYKSSTPEVKSSTFTENDQSSSDMYLQETHRKCYSPTQHESGESGASGSSAESHSKLCHSRPLPHSRSIPHVSHLNYSTPKPQIVPIYETAEYKPTHLTQELLNKHNSLMEKLLIKKHKEARSVSKAEEREKGERREKKIEFHPKNPNNFSINIPAHADTQDPHGIKRPGSLLWEQEGESHKISKQVHISQDSQQTFHQTHQPPLHISHGTKGVVLNNTTNINKSTDNGISTANIQQNVNSLPVTACSGGINLWPPFSVTMTPIPSSLPNCTETITHNSTSSAYPGMYPAVYIIPPHQTHLPAENPGPPKSNGYPFPYMMYPPTMFSTQPFMYSHVAMAYPQMAITSNHLPLPNMTQTAIKPLDLPFDNYRQACQRTINKPMTKMFTSIGETVGASGMPPARLSTCVPPRTTPAESQNTIIKTELSSGVGNHGTKTLLKPQIPPPQNAKQPAGGNTIRSRGSEDMDGEESSYSSFYSSFLKTEASNSVSNADSGGEASQKNSANVGANTTIKPEGHKTKNKDMQWENGSKQAENPKSTSEIVYKNPKPKDSKPSTEERKTSKPVRKMQPPWLDSVCVTSELLYRYQVTSRNIDEVLKADESALENIDQPSLVNEQLSQLYIELQLEGLSSRLKLEEGMTSSSSEEEPTKIKRKKREYNKLVMIYEEDAPLPSPTGE